MRILPRQIMAAMPFLPVNQYLSKGFTTSKKKLAFFGFMGHIRFKSLDLAIVHELDKILKLLDKMRDFCQTLQ